MPSLKDIRTRIDSIKNTQKTTLAMKLVSAAKLKKSQQSIQNLRPYAYKLLQVIADIAKTGRIDHPLLQVKGNVQNILLVVLTSDRGLCGGFNSSIIKFTEKYLNENKPKLEKIDFLFIGRKAGNYFIKRGIKPTKLILNLARDVSYGYALNNANEIMKSYIEGHYDAVHLIYNEFKSALSQKIVCEKLLPIDLSKSVFSNQEKEGSVNFAQDLIFEPSPNEIIDVLLNKHFSIQIYRAMSESVASEHGARMTAMENATKNASELIEKLTLTYNKLRQSAITTELTEITSGAESLKS